MSEIRAVTAETGSDRSSIFTVSFRAFAMREIQPTKQSQARPAGFEGFGIESDAAREGEGLCINIDGTTAVLEGNLGKQGRRFLAVNPGERGKRREVGVVYVSRKTQADLAIRHAPER